MTRRLVSDVMFFVWLAAGAACLAALWFRSGAVAVACFAVSFAAYAVGWLTVPDDGEGETVDNQPGGEQ